MTFETLQKANATIKTTPIKGKDYAEVNQRIKAFRMVYPDGFILTELVSDIDGICMFKATVGFYGEDREAYTLGTGTAYEKETSSFINKTSYIENCETSAVGRALGMAGFGIDTSVASAEEVQNAIENQPKEMTKEKAKENKEEPEKQEYVPVICPQCEKEMKPVKCKDGSTMQPIDILAQFNMCPACLKKMSKNESKNQ